MHVCRNLFVTAEKSSVSGMFSGILVLSPVWSATPLFIPLASRWVELFTALPLNLKTLQCLAGAFLIVPIPLPTALSLPLLSFIDLVQSYTQLYFIGTITYLYSTYQAQPRKLSLNTAAHSELAILWHFMRSDLTFSYYFM